MNRNAPRPLNLMNLKKVPHRYQDKVYYQYLLRTSYRENGQIRHQTVANVLHLPPDALDALPRERLVPVGDAVRIRFAGTPRSALWQQHRDLAPFGVPLSQMPITTPHCNTGYHAP